MDKRCICLDCLYGAQPYGYLPIVCVRERIVEMWYEKHRCRRFSPCPEPEPLPEQEPWQVILTDNSQSS